MNQEPNKTETIETENKLKQNKIDSFNYAKKGILEIEGLIWLSKTSTINDDYKLKQNDLVIDVTVLSHYFYFKHLFLGFGTDLYYRETQKDSTVIASDENK